MFELDRALAAERQRSGLKRGAATLDHYVMMNRERNRQLVPSRRSRIASQAACARWYGDYKRTPCPFCKSKLTHSNGHDRHGKPRLKCSECGKTWYKKGTNA